MERRAAAATLARTSSQGRIGAPMARTDVTSEYVSGSMG